MKSNLDIQKLLELNEKVKNKTANKAEKDELMELLYQNGSITKKQYEEYISGRNVEELLNTGLVVGGIILLGYLLDKLLKK